MSSEMNSWSCDIDRTCDEKLRKPYEIRSSKADSLMSDAWTLSEAVLVCELYEWTAWSWDCRCCNWLIDLSDRNLQLKTDVCRCGLDNHMERVDIIED